MAIRSGGRPRPFRRRRFDWNNTPGKTFTSKDGLISAEIRQTPDNDFDLTLKCGTFTTFRGAQEVAHLLLFALLDMDGMTRNYDGFDVEAFQAFCDSQDRPETHIVPDEGRESVEVDLADDDEDEGDAAKGEAE